MSPLCLLVSPLVLAISTFSVAAEVTPAISPQIKAFPLTAVRLSPGLWLDQEKRDGDYLLSLEPDRLLHCFRLTAGLPAPGEPYGSWEKANGELRGHFSGGHYLTALALMYSATGDDRFKQRGTLMVSELAKCQAQSGYLSAFPESFFDRVEAGKPVWAPYYTVHKIFAGLLAQYELCGNREALATAEKLALYFEGRNGKLSDEQIAIVYHNEAGGFVESLWDLYGLTGNGRIKAFAKRFEKTAFIQPLMRCEDHLAGLHGNTHIPLVLGAVRRYEFTGAKPYLGLSEYFWDRVVLERGWATGGTTGPGEFWGEAGKLSGIMALRTHETCKTYNLLRLSRKLFMHTGNARYAEYFQHAHLNGILGTQGPEPGQFQYYSPMETGYHRWFGFPDRSMWCCYGSGIENFAKAADSIFFHSVDTLYINQFIPSVLDWKEKGLRLAIETSYPEEESVNLVVKAGNGRATLKILHPSWAGKGVALRVNGADLPIQTESGFILVERTWKAGDVVSVRFPMSLRTIPLQDDPHQVAIAYGPVILAGIVEKPPKPVFQTESAAAPQPDAEKKKRAYYFLAGSPADLSWLKPVPDKPLHFRTEGQPVNIDFQPYNSVVSERYGIYWPVVAGGSARQKQLDSVNATLDLLTELEAWQKGRPLEPLEKGFARFIADEALSEYHDRLRLEMARVHKVSGDLTAAARVLAPLTEPFLGRTHSARIFAIVGKPADVLRPVIMDGIGEFADAAAERAVIEGVPVLRTRDARARHLYFAFSPEGRAALAGRDVRLTLKFRSEADPVIQYESATNRYTTSKPSRIETTDGWKIAVFDCPRAQFAGGQNLAGDLRISAANGAVLTVADLKVEVLP